jgi:iron(III) transport system substrate-binding protein
MCGKLKFLWAVAVALPVVFASGARAQSSNEELYKAAKTEGTVLFAGAIDEGAAQTLLKAFSKQYPGISVNYTRRPADAMVQLVEADRLAGKVSFDLINLTEPGDLLRWKKDGFTAAIAFQDIDQLSPETYDPDGHFYALGLTPIYGLYNTNSIPAEEAPKSLKELVTNPKWNGKIAISRPSRAVGTNAVALLNMVDHIGSDFIKRARELNVLLTRGNEAAVTAVISGERPLSWGVSGYRALKARTDGAPVQLIAWEEGIPLSQFIGAVPAKAPHPNAARLLLHWLMSKEGQALMVEAASFYSSRKDIEATPQGEPPLSKLPINYIANQKLVDEGKALAEEYDRMVGLN